MPGNAVHQVFALEELIHEYDMTTGVIFISASADLPSSGFDVWYRNQTTVAPR